MHVQQSERHLPVELLISFFDHLERDREALTTCGLVCRTWLSLTRYRVFSHLHLNQLLADTIINEVPDLFSSPFSTIVPLVTSLKILLSTAREIRNLVPYLTPLSQVKKLYVGRDSLFFRATNNFPVKLLAECFSNVTSLEVAFDFRSFSQLTALVCAFPSLEELHVRSLWEGPATSVPGKQPVLPPSLTTLEISVYTKYILEWIMSLEEMPSICNLSIEVDHYEIPHVNEVLKRQAPSVRRLLWKCGYQSEFSTTGQIHPPGPPNLQWNTALEQLDIAVLYAPDVWPYSSLVEDLLASLSSPALREVSLRQYYPFDESWAQVDNMLAELASPQFQKVSIFSNEKPENILQFFPRCQGRGLIAVTRVDPDEIL